MKIIRNYTFTDKIGDRVSRETALTFCLDLTITNLNSGKFNIIVTAHRTSLKARTVSMSNMNTI